MRTSYQKEQLKYEKHELHPGKANYPKQLMSLGHTSPAIYAIGSLDVLKKPLISIIGARKATPYGLACAQIAGRIAAECGIVVVSGGAIGCDSEAAKSALASGGQTIVIPGCGPDILYPTSNNRLFCDALSTGGCVLSNIAWGVGPTKQTFVSRNEIIAALGQSLIVCEAGLKSGTFTTANMAAGLGKRIYAVPGSIFSSTSRGTNHLLEIGASIVVDEQALEMLISLDYGRLRLISETEAKPPDKLVEALVANPMNTQEIATFLKLDVPSTFALIADYEAAGIIERQFDGKYAPSTNILVNL